MRSRDHCGRLTQPTSIKWEEIAAKKCNFLVDEDAWALAIRVLFKMSDQEPKEGVVYWASCRTHYCISAQSFGTFCYWPDSQCFPELRPQLKEFFKSGVISFRAPCSVISYRDPNFGDQSFQHV